VGVLTIETTRVTLNRQMQRDLQAAIDGYATLIAELADDQETTHTPLEKAIVRNCYFARGDALFDLGRYEEAIKAYSAATNRYQHEPEALEAYVQIAACYRRLDRPAEARVTLEQARVVLQRIPQDVDFGRTTRWQREEWNQLLSWLVTL
jgi:tetratricopeptide (TPR) repeat protein